MGVVIDICKVNTEYSKHAYSTDDFATDATGRLVARPGETFETMPLGTLEVLAYIGVDNEYRQNPYTVKGMRWEVSFSDNRVVFYSPDTGKLMNGLTKRLRRAALGFCSYGELHSLSLGSAVEQEDPYVSTVFVAQVTPAARIPLGVRVHGAPAQLHAFATMLVSRTIQSYTNLSSRGIIAGLDLVESEKLLTCVNTFNYATGAQTDIFITAEDNRLGVTIRRPVPDIKKDASNE